MDVKIADRVKTKASLVVQVVDDYTNKTILDGCIQVSAWDAAKPIRKSEGYYVFINLPETKVLLTVKSYKYSTKTRVIDLSTLSRKEPFIKLRVKPNRNYPLPTGTTCLLGLAEPYSEIRVICESIQRYYRLLYDYEASEESELIHIFNPDQTDLDGKIFQIKEKEDVSGELFSILGTKNRENNLYQLEEPLLGSYKKVGTKIIPVFITQAEENGEYYIPLPAMGEGLNSCNCTMYSDKTIEKVITLELGKINKLNFVVE